MIGLIIFIVHIIGFIASFIILYKKGDFHYAAKYGDGVRTASPFDLLFYCLVWEFSLLTIILFYIEDWFNGLFIQEDDKDNEDSFRKHT